MIAADRDRLSALRTAVALLNLPVRLDLENGCVVVSMPRDLNTAAEVKVLRLVEQHTDNFRRHVA
jgi:hypothetical protein